MLPRWPGLTATHMRALRKNCVSPGSLKAISANRYTDRACHPEHFWIAARCAACSHTPSASGCPHRVKLRRTQHEQLSSGLSLKADIARCSWHVSKVPHPDIDYSRRAKEKPRTMPGLLYLHQTSDDQSCALASAFFRCDPFARDAHSSAAQVSLGVAVRACE